MATLDEIGAALKRAARAGDTAAATKLAAAYRAMQAQQQGPATIAPGPRATPYAGPASNPMAQAPDPAGSPAAPVSAGAVPPQGLKPGSREYAQWAIQQAKAGNALPQVSQAPTGSTVYDAKGTPQYLPPQTGFADQVNAGFTSGVNAVPVAGPWLLQQAENAKAGIYGVPSSQISQEDRAREQSNPVASGAGAVAGTILPFMAGGEIPIVAKALGMAPGMGLGARTLLAGGSNALIGGADAAARGQDPVGGAVIGGAGGLLAPAAGDLLGKWASRVAKGSQDRAVNVAIKSGPASAQEVRNAGSQLFDQAFGKGGGPMISSPALDRLWNDVELATSKFRPNPTNDPQAVGLLSHMQGLMDAAKTPGTVVDLQDMHLARQLASQVARSPGRDGTLGSIVVSKIDDFVKSLRSADILGNLDPRNAANSLLSGISTWNRAIKAGVIEHAIELAQGYKPGVELGLKSTFSNLMRSSDWARFSEIEKNAIRDVAKGAPLQNVASLFGKMGISIGGHGAHNIVGAGVGTMGLAAGLTPFLGPLALPAAAVGTTAAGAIGRRVAETVAQKAAQRAVRVVATPGLPQLPATASDVWGPEALRALLRAAPLGMLPSAATAGQQ